MPHMKDAILVIGSSGQIGTELVSSLRRTYGNSNVIASDIRLSSSDEILQSGPFEVLDIMDKGLLFKIVKKHQITQVYLLAALLSATAEQNIELGWSLNMRSLSHVLDLAKEKHIKKIFWPSSIAVFGPSTPRIMTPQHTIMEPNTVYGISKLAGERWCEYYHQKFNIDVRSVRYPGIIGWQSKPGGGTTDYAVHIFHEAIKNKRYTSFLSENTTLPMMYMSDAIRAIYDEAQTQTFLDHPKSLSVIAEALNPQHPPEVNVRAIAANRRLGTIVSAKRISTFLANPNLSHNLRIQGLYALKSWSKASRLDPIDGRYFPVLAGDMDALKEAIGPEIWALANDADNNISRQAIAVLQSINPDKAKLDQVSDLILDETQRSDLRKGWLRWLRKWDRILFTSVGTQALNSKSPELRAVAAEELSEAGVGGSAVDNYLLATLNNSSDTVELQRAIKMIPRLNSKKYIIEKLVKELIDGRIAPEIQLEVLEEATASARDYPEIRMLMDNYNNYINKQSVMKRYDVAIKGGNAEKGKGIFFSHAQAQCSKCHALKQLDKQIGPSLEGIAKRHSREFLLQSIVDPQAEITLGYGIVTAKLNDNRIVSGTLLNKDKNRITIKLPNNSLEYFATSEIKSLSKPVGTMPDLKAILNLRQVRDLVAYLATLN